MSPLLVVLLVLALVSFLVGCVLGDRPDRSRWAGVRFIALGLALLALAQLLGALGVA